MPLKPSELVLILAPLSADSTMYGPADQLSVRVAARSSLISIVTSAVLEVSLNASDTVTLYLYWLIKSEFKKWEFFNVTWPVPELIWKGSSDGSVWLELL